MRLRRLDLTRYGRFTDFSIDFGERAAERADLHIIYGPNEAGKSTTLAAFLDLLFGIETRSGYDFIHPYATMRIGAALELQGAIQDFVRIKRPHNSLLDHQGQPVAGPAILAELGGLDRDAYRAMFSLDDEMLEAGGKNILASKGDLGQLLFSASAGLADLSHGLVDIEAEAQAFYKFKARSGILSDLKKQLADLKADRDRIDTLATDYGRLVQERDQAAGLYDGTIAARGLVQTRMEEIRRQLGALPRLQALRRIRDEMAPLADLPDAPGHWGSDLPGLQRQDIELGVSAKALDEEIEQGLARIEAIVVDEAAMRQEGRVEQLAVSRARHRTAEEDLPDRRQRLRDVEATIAGLLRRIEREKETDPQRLLLGASAVGRWRDLIEARSGLDAAMTVATGELGNAERRLEAAEAALTIAPDVEMSQGRDAAMAALAAILAALRSDDHAVRHRLAVRDGDIRRAALSDRLQELRPWQGDAEDLAAMTVPDAGTLSRWAAASAEAQKRVDRHADEVERFTTEARRLEAEQQAIGALTGVITDQEAAALRAFRDKAWSEHCQSLDPASAERFEAALRHDDRAVSGRFGHVADLAKLNQVGQALAVAEAEAGRAAELRDAAAATLKSIGDEIAGAIRESGPALLSLPLPQVETWLGRRLKALETRDLARTAERQASEALADAATARRKLAGALEGVGRRPDPGTDVDSLLVVGQAEIDRDRDLKALRVAAEERRRELEARQRQAEEADTRHQTWTRAWADACAACWLGEKGAIPDVATVREILLILADLAAALKEKAGLGDRIDKMQRDQADFENAILAVAAEIGIEGTTVPPLALAEAVERRIAMARADDERRTAETRKLDAARERQRALATSLDIHRRRTGEMIALFRVETLDQVGAKLADSARRSALVLQARDAEEDILDGLRVPTMAEAEAALDAGDRAALDAEQAALQTRFDDLDQRCRELFLAHSKAVDAVTAVGGDGKVAELEERRRTVHLEIEDGALRYLKLRAGTLATEWALRVYRDRHRSSMMGRASQAFCMISRGAYSGLAAQPDKDGETLIALSAGGGSKQADELSKGTRFQLYLALRVAGYHEFAKARRPVPFVADDIMETFDDFRAEEAFRLFGEMAGVGQVIYLTHHRHLCEIATSCCPGATIHEIGAG